jgi:DNA-binding transcriptional MocR family regulator
MPPQSDPRLPTRYDVEWAIERSELPAAARDMLYLLARRMEQGSTLIPGQHSPSLSKIAQGSGWSRRHVLRALNYLEGLGLITRHRPTPHNARVYHQRTNYTVHLDKVTGLGTGSPAEASDAQSHGLRTARRKAKDTQSPELGTARPEARDSAAHSQNLPEPPDQPDPEIAFIRGQLHDRTGQVVSEDQAAGIRALILARPSAQGVPSMAFIRRAFAFEKHPEKWLEPPVPQ